MFYLACSCMAVVTNTQTHTVSVKIDILGKDEREVHSRSLIALVITSDQSNCVVEGHESER